jgi:Tfp pilus assembly protein PilN
MHQPSVKPSVKVFQELNKPAEEAYNLSLKTKKINDQVSEVVKAEAVLPKPQVIEFEQSIVPVQSKQVKKNKKVDASALSNGLQYNGTNQAVPAPAIQVANIPTGNVENFEAKPATSFDLTQKVNEEIGLAPLQAMDMVPVAPMPEITPLSNDFAMSDPTPKTAEQIPTTAEMPSLASPAVAPTPKANDSRFHMPELSQNNSLMTGSVDLIPIAARVRSWKQIMTLLLFSVILSVAILGLLYGYVVYEMQRIIAKDMERRQMISEVDKKILAFSKLNKDISVLGQEIQLVQDTLNKHIYWTNFFALLEKYTVSDVYYSGLAMGTNGGLTLSATTKSYDSVAKQLKIFESADAAEFVTDASITSARQDKDGSVSFQVILNLNQSLFYYRQTK